MKHAMVLLFWCLSAGLGLAAAGNSDLVLCFRDPSGLLVSSLEIDLGPATKFIAPNYGELKTVINANAVEGRTYESYFPKDNPVRWSVLGTDGHLVAQRSLFVIRVAPQSQLDGHASTKPWPNSIIIEQARVSGKFAKFYQGAAFEPNRGYLVPNHQTAAYAKVLNNISFFDPAEELEGFFPKAGVAAADLYRLDPTDNTEKTGKTNFLGTFALFPNGELKFVAARPEPPVATDRR